MSAQRGTTRTAPMAYPHAARTPGTQILLALLVVYIVWGSTYLAIRLTLPGFPPLLMTGLRFTIAGSLLFAALRWQKIPAPTPHEWKACTIVGTLLVTGNACVVVAEQWVSSSLAALAVAAVPLWVALLGGLFGQWPNRREWIGLSVGFVGIVLLNSQGDLRARPLAALVLLIGVICWSSGSAWSRRLNLPRGLMASAAEMLVGGTVLLLAGILRGEHFSHPPAPGALLALFYLIVFGSLLTFSAYDFLLRQVRPALATSYAYVNPAVAIFVGALLGGERITPLSIAALTIILTGVALITWNQRSRLSKKH